MTGHLLGHTLPSAAARNPAYSIKEVVIPHIMNSQDLTYVYLLIQDLTNYCYSLP